MAQDQRADLPPEYARLCQLSPIIPLTPLLNNPDETVSHDAKVCEATEYPPSVTRSCTRLPDALPDPYSMEKAEVRLQYGGSVSRQKQL